MKDYPANSLPLSMGNIRKPLRITVIKTTDAHELFGGMPKEAGTDATSSCPAFKVGDTYTVTDKGGKPPANFPCAWAWHDIFQEILALQLGGNYPEFKNGVILTSCTDGLHPVFFKLERQEN